MIQVRMTKLKKLWWVARQQVMKIQRGYSHSGERVCPEYPDENFQAHVRVYEFMAQFVHGKKVLDVGCGTGYGSYYLVTQRAASVHGIDYSQDAVLYAIRTYRHPHLTYSQMDAQELQFQKATFDVVCSSENLEHLPAPDKNIREIRRVLKPGGVLLLGTPNKEVSSPGSEKSPNPYHIKEFYFEELRDLVAAHFSEVHIFENTLESGDPLGRQMKKQRRQNGVIGIERGDADAIRLGNRTISLTHLKNTHSFMVVAW